MSTNSSKIKTNSNSSRYAYAYIIIYISRYAYNSNKILMYIDDIIIASTDNEYIQKMKDGLAQ